MRKIAGVNHPKAVKVLEEARFRILCPGKHIVMSDGVRILTIPRHNPVNAFRIVRDAGLTVEGPATTSLSLVEDPNFGNVVASVAEGQNDGLVLANHSWLACQHSRGANFYTTPPEK